MFVVFVVALSGSCLMKALSVHPCYYKWTILCGRRQRSFRLGCQQSLDWTTGLDYWTDQFHPTKFILGLKTPAY